MKAVVFLGPTLPHADAAALIGAELRPPAAQGDIFRAVRAGAGAIGLIDGLFLDVASVWHREILHALSEGVHVFGAASMGALRAAELDGFGMRGVGAVYEAYRDGAWPGCDGAFEDDDEVAVVHAPAQAGGGALSDAMVDLRATLLAARDAGVVSAGRADRLIAGLKALHYPERSLRRLADAAPELRGWLAAHAVPQKALDAAEMLREMAGFLAADPPPHRPTFRFERAQVWETFVADEEAREDSAEAGRVLDALRLDPPAWRAALGAALGRDPSPAVASPAERRGQLDALRRTHGLWRRADLLAWMAANGLDEAALSRLLDGEAALDRAARRADAAGRPPSRRIVEHLRATGGYAALLRSCSADDAGPRGPAALDWYFDTLGMSRPDDLDAWVAARGWRRRRDFDAAVARAYRSRDIEAT